MDFVYANRGGNYQGEQFDMVFGPVANDTIYRTFIAYEEGILTKRGHDCPVKGSPTRRRHEYG